MTENGDQRSSLRTYYLASGAIAIPALKALLGFPGLALVGCGTQPDHPRGRHRRLQPTPIGAWCEKHGLSVDKWCSVNADDALSRLRRMSLDLLVVFSFGQILCKSLLSVPRISCVNVHASLLPKYRGAAPVSAAILAGDDSTGISIMRMVSALDAGPVYQQVPVRLTGREYRPDVEQRLAQLTAEHLGSALTGIGEGRLTAQPQPEAEASYAPKLSKADGHVDWSKPADHIERQVRAYAPWPGAWFVLAGRRKRRITITAAVAHGGSTAHPAGSIVQADKHGWRLACGEGIIEIIECIPEGKRQMTGIEFLRGHPVTAGSRICDHEKNSSQLRESADPDRSDRRRDDSGLQH